MSQLGPSLDAWLRRLKLDSYSPGALAGAAAGSAVLLYAVSSFFTSGHSSLAPALSEGEAVDIMGKMLQRIKFAANNMANAHANIKQQIMQQGLQMSDRDIMVNYILPHFEQAIVEAQNIVRCLLSCFFMI